MSSPKSHNQPNNHILFVRSELQCIAHTHTHTCAYHIASINVQSICEMRPFVALAPFSHTYSSTTMQRLWNPTNRLADWQTDRQTDNYSELPEYFYIFTPSHFSFFCTSLPLRRNTKERFERIIIAICVFIVCQTFPPHPIPIIVPISTARMQCNAMPMVATILILPHTYIYKHRRRRCLLFATSMTYLNNRFNCTKAKDMIRVVMEEKR